MAHHGDTAENSSSLFQRFKYTVYALLTLNIFLFLQEEILAAEVTFSGTLKLSDIIDLYAATIDTAAWVVLLILFELETYVIDDDKIKGFLKFVFVGIRSICYGFIVYAFFGYWAEYQRMLTFVPFSIDDVCTLADGSFSYVKWLDEYAKLTAENCGALVGVDLYRLPGADLISNTEALKRTQNLALTDVLNSGAWILVVMVLEADVWLQLKNAYKGWKLAASYAVKLLTYPTLLGAAIYWWIDGDFLDFWDAFLWLVAFIFIELNLLQWQAETKDEQTA